MITGLDHIAIAVDSLNEAIARFSSDFGLTLSGTEDVQAAQTRTAFFPVSHAKIELIAPLDGGGPVQTHLEKRGPGLHHLAFRSDDLQADIKRLQEKGYQLLSSEPKAGAHGSRTLFIHPRSCGGVLIELVQHSDA